MPEGPAVLDDGRRRGEGLILRVELVGGPPRVWCKIDLGPSSAAKSRSDQVVDWFLRVWLAGVPGYVSNSMRGAESRNSFNL